MAISPVRWTEPERHLRSGTRTASDGRSPRTRIYKSIPFFLGEREERYYGVLFDNTWRSSFDFGRENDEEFSFGSQGGPIDYYFLYGPEPSDVMAGYAWLTGPSPLPPLWSFGFQQSRYSYSPESQLMDVSARLRSDKIPADALWLDITVDPERFPNFPKMVSQLARDHFHLIVIADLHIAQKPNSGYARLKSSARLRTLTAFYEVVANRSGIDRKAGCMKLVLAASMVRSRSYSENAISTIAQPIYLHAC